MSNPDTDLDLSPAQHAAAICKAIESRAALYGPARNRKEVEGVIADYQVTEAMLRFETAVLADQEWRRKATEELTFTDALEHWTPDMRADRRGLPARTLELLGP